MKKSALKEKEEQYTAYINALKSKEDKTKGDKAVIWADNVTSKVFIPIPQLIALPIGIIAMLIGLATNFDSLTNIAIGTLLISVVDIVYYSFKNK